MRRIETQKRALKKGPERRAKSLGLEMCVHAAPVLRSRIVGLCPSCRSLLSDPVPREGDTGIEATTS
jgi:hypothetical protein